MLVKVALSCVPSVLTTVMMATEMPAAIRPYSIAVAPDSSFAKRFKILVMVRSLAVRSWSHAGAIHCPGQPNLTLLWPSVVSAVLITLQKVGQVPDQCFIDDKR